MHILGATSGGNLHVLYMVSQGTSFQMEPVVEVDWYKLRFNNDHSIYLMVVVAPRHIHARLRSMVDLLCVWQWT